MNLSKTAFRASFFMLCLFISSQLWSQNIKPLEIYYETSHDVSTNTLKVDIKAVDFDDIVSFQYSFHWNDDVLGYKKVDDFGISSLFSSNFGTAMASTGTITVSWFDNNVTGVTVDDCTTLYTMYFDVLNSGLNYNFNLNSAPTVAEVTRIDGFQLPLFFFPMPCVGGGSQNGQAPYASCEDFYVEDPTPGCVTVNAEDFNADSWDDQDDLYYLVAKVDDSISPDEFDRCYYPSLEFCDDEGDEVEVYFIVLDEDPAPYMTTVNSGSLGCNGTPGLFLTDGFSEIKYDICQSSIKICNSPVPVALTCPSPQNVKCDVYWNDIETTLNNLEGNDAAQNHFLNAHFGAAEFDLPCDFGIEHAVTLDLNQCGDGNIVRNWNAYDLNDPNGNSAWCSQVIFLHHISDFGVEFPADITIALGTSIDGSVTGMPQIFNEDCELNALSYEDQLFTNVPGFDSKIERKWTAINWCAVGTNIGDEIVEVPESELAPPHHDLDGDGDSDERTFRDSWDSIDFPDDIGDVWDGYITYTQTIYVEEPGSNVAVPYCLNGLIVEITPDGTAEIWASDFDAGSWCTGSGSPSISFSQDVNDNTRILTCDDLGDNILNIWATCSTGDQDYCTTYVTLQDNTGVCDPPAGDISISGNIARSDDTPQEGVEVSCKFSGFEVVTTTDADGDYTFVDLPSGHTFTITAFSDKNPEEGVTVFDNTLGRCHILWIDQLTTAEEFLACDVNGTGGLTTFDLVMIDKIIRGESISQSYDVWQFVSNFDDLDDFYSAYDEHEEKIVIPNLTVNTTGHDFTAIKTGDIAPETNPTAANHPLFKLEESAQNNQQLTVDLKVEDFVSISAAQFAVQWNNDVLAFNDLAVTPDGLNFIMRSNEVNGDLRMTMITDDVVSLNDNTIIAQLTFDILQSGDFDLGFADDAIMPKVVVANNCELAFGFFNSNVPSGNLTASGEILRLDGSPMADVEVSCKFDIYSLKTTTDATGYYQFINLPAGEDYTISAFSDQNPDEGVTIFDIAKGACHILGINELETANEFIAFDVNESGTTTTFDLVNGRKFILGQDVSSGISIWHFVADYDLLPNDMTALGLYKTQITLDDLTDHATDQNFTAIKAGDIVPETNPTAAYNPSLSLEEVTVNNQEVILDLTVEDFENIRGIQFALEWDNDILEFADLEQLASPAPGINLNWDFNIVDDKLRLVFQEYLSNDGLTFPDGEALLRLTFNVLQLGDTEVAFAEDDVMPKLVVANFCDLAGGVFNFTNTPINLLSSTNDISLSGLTARLLPNLSSTNTTIQLAIEAENNISIQYSLMNISGVEMRKGESQLISGENNISLKTPSNPGLYFLHIRDEEGRVGQLKLVVK